VPTSTSLHPRGSGTADLVVVLTGAAGAIGSACARELLASGAVVLLCDKDQAALADLARSLQGVGRSSSHVLDVTSPAAVADLVNEAIRVHGRIDVVVNNAGMMHADPVLDLAIDTWRRVFAVNVEGALLMSQAAARVMVTQAESPGWGRRGLLVNVSSRSAEMGRPFSAAYGASKAALNHLTTSLSAALSPLGVVSVVIYPGDVKEGMLGNTLPALAAVQGRSVEELTGERAYQSPAEYAAILRDLIATPGTVLDGHIVRPDRTTTLLEIDRPAY